MEFIARNYVSLIILIIIVSILFVGVYFKIKIWNKHRLFFSHQRFKKQILYTYIAILFLFIENIIYMLYYYYNLGMEKRYIYGYGCFRFFLYLILIYAFFNSKIFRQLYVPSRSLFCGNCNFEIFVKEDELKEKTIICPNCKAEGNF